jgi:hypothetical protein
MNERDANKHGLKDECEREDEQWVCMREGGNAREERREDADNTHVQGKPTTPCHPLTTHVNRATSRAVSRSSDKNTIVTTPIAHSQPYQQSQHHP